MKRLTPIERRLMKMPAAARRRVLMQSYLAARQRGRKGKRMERQTESDLELTIATDGAGVSRILTAVPRDCGVCGFPRTLFVSRNGRTRCYECDHGFCKAEEAMKREQLGLGVPA